MPLLLRQRPGQEQCSAGIVDHRKLFMEVVNGANASMLIGERNGIENLVANMSFEDKLTSIRSSTLKATMALCPNVF